jgi:hypothetical protein
VLLDFFFHLVVSVDVENLHFYVALMIREQTRNYSR